MSDVVMLFSGGLDSTVAMCELRSRGHRVYPLFIRYNQRNALEEYDAVIRVCEKLALCPVRFIDLDYCGEVETSLLKDSALIEEMSQKDIGRRSASTYLPARNITFITLAAAVAESLGAEYVGVGFIKSAGPASGVDCTEDFVLAMNNVLAIGMKSGKLHQRPIRVLTPLIGMPKAEVVVLGRRLFPWMDITRSCYNSGLPCGYCNACKQRTAAFQESQ